MSTADPNWALPDPEITPEFYADVGTKRLIAWFIDTALVSLICLIIIPFTAFIALFFLPLLWLLVSFAYRTLSIANRSSTPGMRLTGIEFRTGAGERFDFGHALLHTLGYTLSVAFVLPQIISILLMAFTPKGQGLTDLVLNSAALNRAGQR